jgi:hypothetical protein
MLREKGSSGTLYPSREGAVVQQAVFMVYLLIALRPAWGHPYG